MTTLLLKSSILALIFMSLNLGMKAELVDASQLRSIIERYEGNKAVPYICPAGHLTVGIGHKVTGREPFKIVKGKAISTEKINFLFAKDLQEAIKGAKAFCLRENVSLENLPHSIQIILIDMAFNLGQAGLDQFVKFRRALLVEGNYGRAAAELIDSKWYRQTGRRARDHVEKIKGLKGLVDKR